MGFIKNLMKMVYIDRISPFDADEVIVVVKTDDITTLDLEMLGTLKELVKTGKRFDLEYFDNDEDKIEILFDNTWQKVIPLNNITIYDESIFHIVNHYIQICFYLDENIHIQVRVAPGELQLNDIYVQLKEFRDEINELCNSSFATAEFGTSAYLDLT